MKLANIKWIYLREVRDQLRDRRTLFTIAVLPLLLYPLMGLTVLQVAQFSREHPTPILVAGANALPSVPPLLQDGQFVEQFCPPAEARLVELTVEAKLPAGVDAQSLAAWSEQQIQSGRYDAIVYFPASFGERLTDSRNHTQAAESTAVTEGEIAEHWRSQWHTTKTAESTTVTEGTQNPEAIPEPALYWNAASDKSRIARNRLDGILRRWREAMVEENLRDRHVPAAATKPFQLVSTDVARERSRRAAVWSKILPFVVFIWALTGAFYPAVDLCAGEKERGTLETLLCSPAQRDEIVGGKLLTIMTFSMTTSLLNLISMGMTGLFVTSRIAELGGAGRLAIGTPPIAALGWLVLALIPLSALFSALSLAVAAFARSSREGQYYLMPLLMITLPLMMLPMMPSVELDLGMSLVPVTGVMLLLRALIEGQYLEALRYATPVIGVTSICCVLSMRWAVAQFNDEAVLFRESERWGLGVWLRHVMRDRRDTPSLADAITCGVLLLVIRFFTAFMTGMPSTWSGFATTTTVSLIAFVAAPALLMAVVLTRSPAKTLLLRLPKPAALPMAVLLALVIHPAGVAFAEMVMRLYPFSPDVVAQLEGLQVLLDGAPHVGFLLIVLALVPAVCEEVAFRGFILSGLRHTGHKWFAIAGASIFFGATHSVLQQSLSACVLGMVLGYLAVQTGSLLPCILFHAVYNSLSLLLGTLINAETLTNPVLAALFQVTEEGAKYQSTTVVLSVVLAGAILLWFRRLPYEHTAEESLQEAIDHQPASLPAK